MGMDRRNAGESGVEIAAALPVADLDRAVDKFNLTPVADRPVAAAWTVASFEDNAFETRLA